MGIYSVILESTVFLLETPRRNRVGFQPLLFLSSGWSKWEQNDVFAESVTPSGLRMGQGREMQVSRVPSCGPHPDCSVPRPRVRADAHGTGRLPAHEPWARVMRSQAQAQAQVGNRGPPARLPVLLTATLSLWGTRTCSELSATVTLTFGPSLVCSS